MSNTPPTYFTIHASATPPSMDIDIDWIRDIHVNENSWSDVGYHYFIQRDGTVQQGRPEHRMGAHVKSHNKKNIGICMAGGLKEGTEEPEDNFTDAQYRALTELLTELHERYPQASIRGHNEFSGHESRGCPCFDVESYRKYIKEAWYALYLPKDWMDHNWKDGIPNEWIFPSSVYDELSDSPSKSN